MTATSHGRPSAGDIGGDNRVRVYEEAPGWLTISFSGSPGMWSGITVPADATWLVIGAIKQAAEARESAG